MDHPSKRNIARGQEGDVLTVSGLTRRIKSLLERQVGACWIRGEISNLRSVASGHHYFTLKDEGAQLSAVAFRGNAGAFLPILEEGRQVLAFGEVTVYEIRGNYQVIVRHLLEDGVGRLQQEFERLKQKLSSEGLFDEDRKKPIPAIPKKVAFLTSPTGAAVEDFRSILQNQGWPGEIYIIPSIVQGAEAPASLLAGLKLAGEIPGLELLVLGRGGGSLEDLVCFNDEALVRALSKFQLPTISAVGHEIDFVLTDFVADRRAETPTAAAGLILNNFLDFRQRTQNVHLRLRQLWKQNLSSLGRDLHHLMQRLQALRPKGFIENSFQRLDDLLNLLVISTQDGVREKNQLLQNQLQDLGHLSPELKLPLLQAKTSHVQECLVSITDFQLERGQQAFESLQKRLGSASMPRTLARGYTIVSNSGGKVLTNASEVSSGEQIQTRFIDGVVRSIVE